MPDRCKSVLGVQARRRRTLALGYRTDQRYTRAEATALGSYDYEQELDMNPPTPPAGTCLEQLQCCLLNYRV